MIKGIETCAAYSISPYNIIYANIRVTRFLTRVQRTLAFVQLRPANYR